MRGKLGLVLMGGAMLSKSLIQFSVDGWSCVPSLLFTWGQTMVEAHQAPPSMEFSRQEYWSGLPFPSPGIFPTQESNPGLPHCRQTLPSEPSGNPMKIMVTSFKRPLACSATFNAPNPAASHYWPTPPLETLGHSRASLGQSLVGSLLLSSGSWCTKFCCALQESISHSYVSSGSCMVGLMVTSSKRAYSIPKSAAPRAPVPLAVHC